MTKLQRCHNSNNQLVCHHQLDLPLLNPLNLPRLAYERLTAVQRPKLTRPEHLPGAMVIVANSPATGSEHSVFDHFDMTVGNKKSEFVHDA